MTTGKMAFLKRSFQVLVYLLITTGFSYQAFLVCQEYFKYPTATLVSILDALPVTLPPRVALCTGGPNAIFTSTKSLIHHTLRELFTEKRNDNTIVVGSGIIDPQNAYYVKAGLFDAYVQLNKFFVDGMYCFEFKTRDPLYILPEDLFRKTQLFLYFAALQSNISDVVQYMYTSKSSGFKPPLHINFHIFMTTYDSDFEGVLRTPLDVVANNTIAVFEVGLTYGVKMRRLASPPYDTNCRDYTKDGFTSSHNCKNQCLNNWTEEHGMILQDHVIYRDKYEDSDNVFLPWFLKTNWVNESFLTEWKFKWTKNQKSRLEYADKVIKLLPSFQERWRFCNEFCRQPDCVAEAVTPRLMSNEKNYAPNKKFAKMTIRNGSLEIISISVFPPHEPVVIVISAPKIHRIDFVVYILSCLSFWYGFCPLQFADSGYGASSKVVVKLQRTLRVLKAKSALLWKVGKQKRAQHKPVLPQNGILDSQTEKEDTLETGDNK